MRRYLNKIPLILCFLVAFVLGMKQLREPDIWWQLLSGRWMLEHGRVTYTDVFSYTMYGHPWVNVKWLYEILIALIEKGFGPQGVILLQSAVSLAILWLLFRILRTMNEGIKYPISQSFTVIAALLFLLVVEYRMAGRPEMFSHLFCAVYLFFLFRFPEMKWKHMLWLVVLQCLWANMHEGYPVGLAMSGTFFAGSALAYLTTKNKTYLQQTYRALLLLVAAFIVILVNPNGIVLWKQPFEIYRQVLVNKYTTELYSFTQPEYWTLQAKIHIVLLGLVIVFWISKLLDARKRKDVSLYTPALCSYLILIPLFGFLSLTANRNIPFSEIIMFPSVVMAFGWLTQRINKSGVYVILQKRSLSLSSLIALCFYIAIVSNKYYIAIKSPNRYGIHVNMLHNPIGASAFLKEHNIKGACFSDYFISSYLLWSLSPDFKSYIDLRDLDVFPAPFFDDYFSMYQHPEKFYELDKQHHFNYVVLSTSQLIGLQQKLYYEKGFYMIYVDPVSVIFLREDDNNKALTTNTQIQKPFSWPLATEDPSWAGMLTKALNPFNAYTEEDEFNMPKYAGAYYNAMRDYPQAIKLLRSATDDPDALRTLAFSYNEYSKAVKDPRMKQKLADSAQIFLDQANNLK